MMKELFKNIFNKFAQKPEENVSNREASVTTVEKAESKAVTEDIASVTDGQVIAISEVKDPVFSQKMMGDGFAIEPENGNIYSPVTGTVTSIFPTKHAISLLTDSGLEVLLHIGIETVSLEGKPFEVHVTKGQKVAIGDLLVTADLEAIKSAGRETSVVVIFTNGQTIKSVIIEKLGQFPAKTIVAKVEL